MDFKPIRRTWRGVTYDSQLETDWAATFQTWGLEYEYHPGWMLLDNGDRYEPDFLLDGDIVFEVKGDHDDRIDKAWRAASEFGLRVIVGRAGFVAPGSDLEYAGAVWEGHDKIWTLDMDSMVFVDSETLSGNENVAWSADYAYRETGLSGVRWFKAVGDDEAR